MKRYLYLLLYFLAPLIPAAVLYQSNPMRYQSLGLLSLMIIGVYAYTLLIFQFVIIARPKLIEVSFGMDRLYRFHGLIAIVLIVLAFIHKLIGESMFSENLQTTVGSIALIIFIGILLIALLLMVNSSLTKLKLIRWFRNQLNSLKLIHYEHYVIIHNLTVLALVMMFIHVLMTSNALKYPAVSFIYSAYFFIGASFYTYHKFIKQIFLKEKPAVITQIIQEGPNMRRIQFTGPKLKGFRYKPGQFGFFQFINNQLPFEEHPFTISSSPSQKEVLEITVKALGDFSSSLHHLEIGDQVLVDAPYGRFSYMNHPREKETVMVVGGVGITPALSMLRHMRDTYKDKKVLLIWGVREARELICRDEFKAFEADMEHFHFVPIISTDDASWEGEKGYIDYEKIERLIHHFSIHIEEAGFYLCGPSVLMDATIKNLKTLGVHRGQIHHEKFSL